MPAPDQNTPDARADAKTLAALAEKTGHRFRNPALLKTALTHASTGAKLNYERLEFLGDRVLGLAVAELLYAHFPGESEGDLALRLAALVQGKFLAGIAHEIGLGDHIALSPSEAQAGGAAKENILADVLEALIGALYLDAGLDQCRAFIAGIWTERLHLSARPPQHPKTRLQEWAQGAKLPLPAYKVTGRSGPDHAPAFVVELYIEGHPPLSAQGPSRQAAEREVAALFLQKIETETAS